MTAPNPPRPSTAPARLARKRDAAVRIVERWATPSELSGGPAADTPAYRALVDALVGAMVAVGPAEGMEGVTALVKTLALMIAATLRLEDDAKVSEICAGMAGWIENEVMAIRQARASTAKKDH